MVSRAESGGPVTAGRQLLETEAYGRKQESDRESQISNLWVKTLGDGSQSRWRTCAQGSIYPLVSICFGPLHPAPICNTDDNILFLHTKKK
jgi:hypothetical protein